MDFDARSAQKAAAQLSVEELQSALALLAEMPKGSDRHLLRAQLYRAWAARDPQAAWMAALAAPHEHRRAATAHQCGPRPLPVYEIERIEKHAQRRLSVKPGLTCLWQVTGRNGIKNFDEWVALDLKCIDNWSLWLDVKILAQTLPAVLRGAGAS